MTVTLLIGGARSGKSSLAVARALDWQRGGSLIRNVSSTLSGKRTWTPVEVRDLIGQRNLAQAAAAVAALDAETPDRDIVAMCLNGEIAFRDHRDAEAEMYFREALKLAPGRGDAHYGLSLVMLARGDKP